MLGAITNPSGRLSSAPSTAPSVEMISHALGAVGRRIVSIRALKAPLAQCKGVPLIRYTASGSMHGSYRSLEKV